MILSGVQARMARAALKMSVRDLASAAQVSPNTVTRLEADQACNAPTLLAIRSTFEAAGIEFIPENGGGVGVRLTARTSGPPAQGG
jgi:transcriptional regulator with XRE-family HTH domain